ncbi:chemotaxis protein CheW [Chitinivibrio alkaliphilus]|uniref:Chemotaxis protein CheW n=1 Tax=Chitinivibrio alkaliphilus ACht1 TaxID=1313304 RepID=U7DBA5_9BACT|nr:chemotaxis protein CheW [Chitinivibrio alkaliphilus]ERP31705.1 chemotaxis protein CheW [Chitinivibrio alkaliphilus ACht1]
MDAQQDMTAYEDERLDIGSDEENTLADRYLTFWLGTELYAMAIEDIIEIVGVQRITPVPDTPYYVKGVVNLRGQVIPVIDARLRMHMSARDYDEETCTVVVSQDDVSVGIIVDTVDEVFTITEEQISSPPKISNTPRDDYMEGISRLKEKTVMILNTHKLLYQDENE